MSQLYVPTAFNLIAPIMEAIAESNGFPTSNEQSWRTNLAKVLQQISGIQVVVSGGDATTAIQTGINQAIVQGGGVVILPAGQFTMGTVSIPVNGPPIWIIGQGPATTVTRNVALAPGVGIFDISSSNFWMSDFVIDGGRTVPVGMRYNADFSTAIGPNDPMAPSLTNNTSVWVHGSGSGFRFERMVFQHAAGYSLLLDATTGDISDIDVLACWFLNNRPTLFGSGASASIYGSWNGGLFFKGDGRTAVGAQSGVVSNVLVQGNRFERNTGNCAWSHNYGFNRFNSNFRYISNQFVDCGLDGILVDIVSGGAVIGNTFRRIGYTTLTDTDQSVPRWLPGLNATAIDSGIVKGFSYVGNSMTSVNGGSIDADTFGQGVMSGNVCRIPFPDEPEFLEDSIAISGPTDSGNGSYGINMGCNYPVIEGANNVEISGNSLINLPAGAIRLYSARFVHVHGNLIYMPDVSTYAPITMGPQGAASYQRCFNNKIHHNHFQYSPGAPSTPLILEDDSLSGGNPFTGGEQNFVFGNCPIAGNGNAIEFTPSGTSGSVVYLETPWFT